MRYVSFVIAVFVLLLAVVPAFCASDTRDLFHEWALKKGEGFDTEWNEKLIRKQRADFDQRWNSIAISKESSPRTGRGTHARYKSAGASLTYDDRPKTGRAKWPVSSAGFIHKGNKEFLPSSTRPRNSPSRGISTLKNPARATRGNVRDPMRGLRSSTRLRNIFGQQRGVSRPRLKSPGRHSNSKRRGRHSPRMRAAAGTRKRYR